MRERKKIYIRLYIALKLGNYVYCCFCTTFATLVEFVTLAWRLSRCVTWCGDARGSLGSQRKYIKNKKLSTHNNITQKLTVDVLTTKAGTRLERGGTMVWRRAWVSLGSPRKYIKNTKLNTHNGVLPRHRFELNSLVLLRNYC